MTPSTFTNNQRLHQTSRLSFEISLMIFVVMALLDMITFALIPAQVVPLSEINPLARLGGFVGIIMPKATQLLSRFLELS